MRTYIKITADYNDGDYVTSFKEVKETHLKKLKDIIEVIKACDAGHNWPDSEYVDETIAEIYKGKLSKSDINLFGDYMPCAPENDVIHSIDSIELFEVSSVTKLI